jgi:nitric oxide dioxygenase
MQTALTMFYERLFQVEFKLRVLFRSDPEQQKHRLSQALELLLAHASDLEPILPMLRGLGRRHRTFGVRAEDYDTAGGALLWTLERLLGDQFDVEHQSAWLRVYRELAKVMVEAAADGRSV